VTGRPTLADLRRARALGWSALQAEATHSDPRRAAAAAREITRRTI
jgi:hypothetical protein